MSFTVAREQVGPYKVIIHQDDSPENPREWDNIGTMLTWHRRYNLGDEQPRESWPEVSRARGISEKTHVILPLFFYDHSSQAISTKSFVGRAQHAEWDSGQVGVIIARVGRGKHKSRKYLTEALEAEVKSYDDYLQGNCWGYVIELNGEHVDSCWGFLGDSQYALDEGIAAAKALPQTVEEPELEEVS